MHHACVALPNSDLTEEMDAYNSTSLVDEAGLNNVNEEKGDYTRDGSVDAKGNPAERHSTGCWRASAFILGTECFEQLSFFGIQYNLVSFLTAQLHQSNATAARNYTIWQGTCYIAPLAGAILADSYLGRYWTTVAFFSVYLIGMGTMTLSAASPASINPSIQPAVFSLGLYMMAIGAGCIKSCVGPLSADQFDGGDPAERLKKNSFFNWFYFAIYVGGLVAGTGVVWVQDNHGWVIGFGIPALCTALAMASFLLGSKRYRFLDKAAIASSAEEAAQTRRLCTQTEVEELKAILRILPVWATGIVYYMVLVQQSLFLEQGRAMRRRVGAFSIPPASLNSIYAVTVLALVPLYDRAIVPVARRLTGNERGFSELQRIGVGLTLSVAAMAAAASVEARRLAIAADEKASMSIVWQVPQYLLLGASAVFTCVGQLEFFYNQAPDSMRSLCSALGQMTWSLGSYLSSITVTVVSTLTVRGGAPGWIADDLNDGHLDRFFWLVAGLSLLNLMVFMCCAKKYNGKK